MERYYRTTEIPRGTRARCQIKQLVRGPKFVENLISRHAFSPQLMTDSGLVITPSTSGFGCTVSLPTYAKNDPYKLNDDDFRKLYVATLTHLVIVLPGLAKLSPESQFLLTKRFDPTIAEPKASEDTGYGHGKEFRHTQSVLRKDGISVKSQPQVQILGQGTFAADEPGNENGEAISLTHPSHSTFHRDPLTDDQIKKKHQTRFYRWHIDSALYGLSPPMITTLLGIKVPAATQRQLIDYDDGTGDKLSLTQGATCFVSGAAAFERLSEEEKNFVLNTTVEYAPHPYMFISPAKAEKDGLTMVSEGLETDLRELPEWENSKIKRLPMVWTNPVTRKHHLQVHGCCIFKLHTKKGDMNETLDLKDARDKVRSIMRPAISPSNVLAHSWKEGDLVIFFNRGVWHTVTGEFKAVKDGADEKRLMHQCNLASGADPVTVR